MDGVTAVVLTAGPFAHVEDDAVQARRAGPQRQGNFANGRLAHVLQFAKGHRLVAAPPLQFHVQQMLLPLPVKHLEQQVAA